MKCIEITNFIESIANINLAEQWDNVGLIIGSKQAEIRRVLVCLDVTSKVVDEAIDKKVDLIISHHPFIFKGIKKINYDDYKGNMIHKLVKNDINVYSVHTNLDFAFNGLNNYLAKVLELESIENLKDHISEKLFKIVVFIPEENVDDVRQAMSDNGAGMIGNYSHCFFEIKGTGSFKPLEGTNPYIGQQDKIEYVNECRLETIVNEENLQHVINSMIKTHPYEEVAYDVYPLNIKGKSTGYGNVGLLKMQQTIGQFINTIKNKLNINTVKLIGDRDINSNINKVAVFCGGFDESLINQIKGNADIIVSGDIKYHITQEIGEMGMCAIDAGHFGTEAIIGPYLKKLLDEQFDNLVSVMISENITDFSRYV